MLGEPVLGFGHRGVGWEDLGGLGLIALCAGLGLEQPQLLGREGRALVGVILGTVCRHQNSTASLRAAATTAMP